jgi:uncharacterized membrane protein
MGLVLLLVILCSMSALRYLAMTSNVADLGFFMANFMSVGEEWQRAFFGHVQPLMLIWGGAYRSMSPALAPVVLVVAQAGALIWGVSTIWRTFGLWAGLAMAWYYPLWANALFDFHFDHLAVPLLAAFFVACERRAYAWAALAAAALSLVKEPFALQTSACGLYLLWLALRSSESGHGRQLCVLGLGLAAGGLGAFVFMVKVVMPFFSNEVQGGFGIESTAFSWLGTGLADIAWSLLTRPLEIVADILGTPGKLLYLSVIFGLLAFIPLLAPAPLIVAAPLLLIALLSRLDNYYTFSNHYTAGVIVPAIVAFAKGLPAARAIVLWFLHRIRVQRVGVCAPARVFTAAVLLVLLGGHWALSSSPISRLFWSEKVWSYSWTAYVPDSRDARFSRMIDLYVPADPRVSVAVQNTVNSAGVSHRRTVVPFPLGVDAPIQSVDWSNRTGQDFWRYLRSGYREPTRNVPVRAEWIVLDMKRPWFVADRGCDWIYGRCRNAAVERDFLAAVDAARARYEVVFEEDGMVIMRLRAEAS